MLKYHIYTTVILCVEIRTTASFADEFSILAQCVTIILQCIVAARFISCLAQGNITVENAPIQAMTSVRQ